MIRSNSLLLFKILKFHLPFECRLELYKYQVGKKNLVRVIRAALSKRVFGCIRAVVTTRYTIEKKYIDKN